MALGSSVKNGNNRDFVRSNIKKNTKKRKNVLRSQRYYRFPQRLRFVFMTSAENQITGKNGLIFYCELIIVGKNNVFLRLLFSAEMARNVSRNDGERHETEAFSSDIAVRQQ